MNSLILNQYSLKSSQGIKVLSWIFRGAASQRYPNPGQDEYSAGINKAYVQRRDGMGETGETYLVGEDKLMRSDSFLDPVNHSVKASFASPGKGIVDTEAGREALSGRSGKKVIADYNGNPVLSDYAPVKVGDTTWAVIAAASHEQAQGVEQINRAVAEMDRIIQHNAASSEESARFNDIGPAGKRLYSNACRESGYQLWNESHHCNGGRRKSRQHQRK